MKNKVFVSVLIAVIFCSALLFTGCQTTARTSVSNYGIFGEQVRIPVKDFESLGLVFVEVQFEAGNRGQIDGDTFTFQKLLKEAHALGADSIINVVIDRRVEHVINWRGRIHPKETRFASALAIRFTDTIVNHITTTTTEDGRTIVAAEQAILNNARAFTGEGSVLVRDTQPPPVQMPRRWWR